MTPPDMREAVTWAYRLLLGREPNDAAAIDLHAAAHHSVPALRAAFMTTPEFLQTQTTAPVSPLAPAETAILDRFKPFSQALAPAGSWRDFLGITTRCAFLPSGYDALPPGAMQAPPGAPNGPLHDRDEWLGTLRSVLEARRTFTAIELGAGWAPWLVAAHVAATRVGIHDIRLIGVEGSAPHVAFMHQHLRDNAIDPTPHRLLHGVAGPKDGIARFPRLHDARNDYGSQADYASNDPASNNMEEVPCYSLDSLLAPLDHVDILHCDIQGMEAEVFAAAQSAVNAKVRRTVIGTHSRHVEAQLLETFSTLGWTLEDEIVCKLHQAAGGTLHLQTDGCQVWRNPAFD